METSIDYSAYSLADLISAKEGIDATAYPERAQLLDKLIAEKTAQQKADQPERQVVRKSGVTFHGNGKEYFAIWIVNLLLTIVTLGIYSAWAKVRTNRYFYSNTEIDGHRFSYLADPLQILKGRIIGLILFGGYFLANAISPLVALGILLVLLFVTPFLICQSMKFNMKMTGYRNIRFGFKGDYGEAFLTFILYPILSVFTLYLAFPWVLKKMDEFIVSNMTFGEKEFTTNLETGEYFLAAIGAFVIGIIIFVAGFSIAGIEFSEFNNAEQEPQLGWSMMSLFGIYIAAFVFASSFYAARVRNHLFSKTDITTVAGFESDVSFAGLLWLRSSNLLALALTLGFALPWVKVRTTEYFANATQVHILQDADSVTVDPDQSASAVGDEVADVFDIDVSIG